MSKNVHSEDLG